MTHLTGAIIRLFDFSVPLAKRKARRKLFGPNMWRVGPVRTGHDRDAGQGFYFGEGNPLRMGTGPDLRIYSANDFLRGTRLYQTDGYYGDDYGYSVIRPFVIRLSHGRGFLAAYGEGPGMWGSFDSSTVYDTEEEAARAAHDEAKRAAEREQEYQAEENARLEEEEAAEEAQAREMEMYEGAG